MAMLDSRPSHNFIKGDVARRLGLKFVPTRPSFKVVNSEEGRVLGIGEDVPVKIGSWKEKVDFTIIKMDDYEAVLGIEFMIE